MEEKEGRVFSHFWSDVESGENKDGFPAGNPVKYLHFHLSLQMGLATTEGEFPDHAEISFRLRNPGSPEVRNNVRKQKQNKTVTQGERK